VGNLKDLKKCYMDPNSYTNCDQMLTKHFHLSFTVDFEKQSLIGSNTLTVQALTDNVNQLILDYQGIMIIAVQQSIDGGKTFSNITFSRAEGRWGSALTANLQSSMLIKIKIIYRLED
jgi:leukotriene-A4 hydrolase